MSLTFSPFLWLRNHQRCFHNRDHWSKAKHTQRHTEETDRWWSKQFLKEKVQSEHEHSGTHTFVSQHINKCSNFLILNNTTGSQDQTKRTHRPLTHKHPEKYHCEFVLIWAKTNNQKSSDKKGKFLPQANKWKFHHFTLTDTDTLVCIHNCVTKTVWFEEGFVAKYARLIWVNMRIWTKLSKCRNA